MQIEKWFDVENYVQFLVERIRSIIRREAKRHNIRDFHANAVDVVRDLILGTSDESKNKRPGRTFEENGMIVFDVDVLSVEICDDNVSELLIDAEQRTLRQQLELTSSEKELVHTCLLEEIKRELLTAKEETRELTFQLQLADTNREHQLTVKNSEDYLKEERTVHTGKLDIQDILNAIASSELKRREASDTQVLENAKKESEIRVHETKGRAEAITPELITAIQSMSEKELAERLAKSLGPLTILGGESVVDIAKRLFAGTPVEAAIASLAASAMGGRIASVNQ